MTTNTINNQSINAPQTSTLDINNKAVDNPIVDTKTGQNFFIDQLINKIPKDYASEETFKGEFDYIDMTGEVKGLVNLVDDFMNKLTDSLVDLLQKNISGKIGFDK